MVARHTVTLANSIVGVSVLAMPFCFKQCGIVLATLSLMMGAIITRMVCYFLLKAALMSRRRTYEMLAWSTFGHTGKFMVEISMIGFLIGTLIAFMVVIGDLGPEILSEIFSVEINSSLRTITMTALSLFVALPLGLLRNIDSLSSVSSASVLFYLFLVLKIFSEGIGPLWSGEYLERIDFWKSGGVLQCIPIFSMALSCQTQIFCIYDALPEPSLQKMNEIVKNAVNICTFFYFCVGFFGYIAFSQHNFGGNILLSFSPAWSTQLIKSMFLMSVVFSVPLVVFPCRASLNSMIFRSGSTYHQVHDMSTNYIPESRLKFLTVTIVGFTLIVGILVPNIELVLGLVGSTTGSVICIIFPSIMFVRVTSKNTTERLLAQGVFFIGVVLMLLTTYATLYAAEQSQISEKIPEPLRVTDNLLHLKPVLRQEDVQMNSPLAKLDEGKVERVEFHRKTPEPRKDKVPPLPPRVEVSSQKPNIEKVSHSPPKKKVIPETEHLLPKADTYREIPKSADIHRDGDPNKANYKNTGPGPSPVAPQVKDTGVGKDEKPGLNQQPPSKDSIPVGAVQPNGDVKKEFVDKQVAEAFLKKLEEHQENQKKLLEEQKEILQELKQHHAHDVREKIEKERHVDKDGIKSDGVASGNVDLNVVGQNEPKAPTQDKAAPVADDASAAGRTADKITQEQEKIIEKISENIEKESKNVQLLEKLEEGLNKEVQMLDSQKKVETKDDKSIRKEEYKAPQQNHEEAKDVPPQGSFVNADNSKSKQAAVEDHQVRKESSPSHAEREKPVHVETLGSKSDDTRPEMHKQESANLKPEIEGDIVKSKNEPIVDGSKSSAKHDAYVQPANQKSGPEEVAPPPVVNNKGPEDSKINQNENKNINASPDKKITSEKTPKEKVDREI